MATCTYNLSFLFQWMKSSMNMVENRIIFHWHTNNLYNYEPKNNALWPILSEKYKS